MDKFIQIIRESKKVKTNIPINEMSQYRWSPRSFETKTIEKDKLMSIMESARWTASAFNEQPWRFIIGFNGDDTFNKILETMVEFNQNWAKNASVLVLNIYKNNFTHNNTPNVTAQYDLGQAVGSYCLETVNQGLVAHQMSGFDTKKADLGFKLGDEYTSLSVTAIGYLGKPDALPEDLLKIELQNRMRKTVDSIVFTDQLEQTPFSL
ncbi:MAG: nitroreductase [Bacteroidales bacterium]|nr:nitroreductase [Bacteroidales bacterium]